jgi:hypothetical protein
MTSRESIIITSLAFSFKGQTFHREIFSSARLYTSASGETSEYVRTPGIRAVALPAAGEKQGYAGNTASIIPDVLLLSADPEPLVWHLAAGYGVMGLVFLGMTRSNSARSRKIDEQ